VPKHDPSLFTKLTKISDPKVKAGAVELMTQLLMREKKEKPGKEGPVAKAMGALAEAKDSGSKLLHKKITEAADPEAAAKKDADKKGSPKKESKKSDKEAKDDKKKGAKKGAAAEEKVGGGGAGNDDDKVRRLDMTEDDALDLMDKAGVANWSQLLKDLSSTGWAEKMAAFEKMGQHSYGANVHVYSPAVVTVMQAKTGKWKEKNKNANVMKGLLPRRGTHGQAVHCGVELRQGRGERDDRDRLGEVRGQEDGGGDQGHAYRARLGHLPRLRDQGRDQRRF